MTTQTMTLDTLDVPLPGGRVLRLARHVEADGEAELVIACGFPSDGWAKLMARAINLPASALPELVRALETLGGLGRGAQGGGVPRNVF